MGKLGLFVISPPGFSPPPTSGDRGSGSCNDRDGAGHCGGNAGRSSCRSSQSLPGVPNSPTPCCPHPSCTATGRDQCLLTFREWPASPPAQQRPGAATCVPQDPVPEFASLLQVRFQSPLPSSWGMEWVLQPSALSPASHNTPDTPVPGSGLRKAFLPQPPFCFFRPPVGSTPLTGPCSLEPAFDPICSVSLSKP